MKKNFYFNRAIILLIILLLFYPITILQVIDGGDRNNILFVTPVKKQDQFSIQWIHSVTKQPVIETYEIYSDLTIGIYEMLFNENGPNLPHGPEGGTKWEIKDGMFRVYNYNLVFDEVPVRIGEVIANHTLIYKDHVVELKDISRPGGFVRIGANKTPLMKYLYKEVRLWLKIK